MIFKSTIIWLNPVKFYFPLSLLEWVATLHCIQMEHGKSNHWKNKIVFPMLMEQKHWELKTIFFFHTHKGRVECIACIDDPNVSESNINIQTEEKPFYQIASISLIKHSTMCKKSLHLHKCFLFLRFFFFFIRLFIFPSWKKCTLELKLYSRVHRYKYWCSLTTHRYKYTTTW